MSRVLKGLAIAMLLITVIGAGAVLYGLSTFEPHVEQVLVAATPASQAQETFDAVLAQLDNETFAGTRFASADGLDAQSCTFLTYTVRLKNRGFFPAEWVSMAVQPESSADGASRDVLQLGGDGAYVLSPGGSGDLSATILRTGDASNTTRKIALTCYVFGQRIDFAALAQ